MSIALVSSIQAQSTNENGFTSSAIDTSGANLISFCVASYSSVSAPTVSDSKGNTWTGLTVRDNSALGRVARIRMFYCVPASVGSGHTFTVTGVGTFPAIDVRAFSGAHATPFDTENWNAVNGVNTLNAGSVTPAGNGSLIIGAWVLSSSGKPDAVVSVSDSFASLASLTNNANAFGIAAAHLIQGTAGAMDESLTWNSNDAGPIGINSVFKPGASGGFFARTYYDKYIGGR